ncbi:anthranilate synthase component II [Legionella busanensis]|uniref:Anthranilate synthase component II n=1 Tax=Legionella busanensis TaxID=190655 RepID=A0A378JIL3_9GAMM|nr:aminodeoxychorismate/anthranilate synthase component II [Legionella busanensis]STX51146.1 anthranilate synthase component II [Legionella busanensis]
MLLLIDNYDSFTYNLVQYFQILNQDVRVFKNNDLTITDIEQLSPSHIVISPGPKGPLDAGISLATIAHFYQTIPILGICLGHQCLAHAFGAKIIQAPETIHGKTSPIIHHKRKLFQNLPNPFQGMRYHSLAIDVATLPTSFAIDAWANDTIMAISHRQYPLFGLQFHPESILSEYGLQLLANFLNYEACKNF